MARCINWVSCSYCNIRQFEMVEDEETGAFFARCLNCGACGPKKEDRESALKVVYQLHSLAVDGKDAVSRLLSAKKTISVLLRDLGMKDA